MTMTETTTARSTREEVLARIEEIGPLLRENAATADQERRMPEASIEAIASTGAFALTTPERFGGLEEGARTLVEVARALGRFDTSASWLTVISNGSVMLTTRFPESAQQRVFANGPVRMSSVIVSPGGSALREGDGYRVAGEWPFSSNSAHADWAIGVVPVRAAEDDEPQLGYALFHRDQFTIRDTWYTIGMRGTASNTMVIEDAWLPADQILLAGDMLGPGSELAEDSLPVQRLAPVSTMSTAIATPVVGAAEAALALVAELAHQRGVTYSNYTTQASSAAFAHGLGAARAKIDAAALLLARSADALDAAASGTVPLSPEERARTRGDVAHAVHSVVDATNDLVWLHGTAAFGERSPLGRLWRDVNTGARHALTASPLGYELSGTGLLGVPAPAPLV